MALLPNYWNRFSSLPVHEKEINRGITDERNPWIGAEDPVIIIKEYSDYMCFQCYKNHYFLRNLVAKYPDKIRLVHMNYPLDKEYNSVVVSEQLHAGSGRLSLLSVYSVNRADFWEINDKLYKLGRTHQDLTLADIIESTGLLKKDVLYALNLPIFREYLRIEILTGMKYGITGTPTYIIDDKVYPGLIPEDEFKRRGIEW